MMFLIASFVDVLFRILVKRLLAAGSAEVVSLSLVLGCPGCGVRVNFHTANRINDCVRHRYNSFSFSRVLHETDCFRESKITSYYLRNLAYIHKLVRAAPSLAGSLL